MGRRMGRRGRKEGGRERWGCIGNEQVVVDDPSCLLSIDLEFGNRSKSWDKDENICRRR